MIGSLTKSYICNWDLEIRKLASNSLKAASKIYSDYIINHSILAFSEMKNSALLDERSASLLALGSIISSLAEKFRTIPSQILNINCPDLSDRLIKDEHIVDQYLYYLSCLVSSKWEIEFSDDEKYKWISLMRRSMKVKDEEILLNICHNHFQNIFDNLKANESNLLIAKEVSQRYHLL